MATKGPKMAAKGPKMAAKGPKKANRVGKEVYPPLGFWTLLPTFAK